MKLIIGSDHAGFKLKEMIKDYLEADFDDLGTDSEEPFDYPLIAQKVAKKVVKENATGILICGSGIGVSIAANKIKGARAALCTDKESAKMAREHNNANILCLGARTKAADKFTSIVDTFLSTDASVEERHVRRVNELNDL